MSNADQRSAIFQVAMTYGRPMFLRLCGGALVLLLLWLFTRVSTNPQTELLTLTMGAFWSIWFAITVTAHLKEQLADPRAALTPGFRWPHLLVGGVIFAAGTIALPAIVASWQEQLPSMWGAPSMSVSWPAYTAMVFLGAAMMAWVGHVQTPLAIAISVAAIATCTFPRVLGLIADIVSGRRNVVAAVIFAASATAMALLWWRLARMHEEMPEYSRLSSGGLRLKAAMTGDRALRGEAQAGAGAVDEFIRGAARLDQVHNIAAAGFFQRVWHQRRAIGLGRMPLLAGTMLGIWTFVMPLLLGARNDAARSILPLTLTVLVPGLLIAGAWPQRWYLLPQESLRPAARWVFLLEQGAVMALELAITCVSIAAAVIAAGLLLELVAPVRTGLRSDLLRNLWRAVPLAIGGQVLIFGIIAWIMRFRSGWLLVLPMMVATVAGAGLLALIIVLVRQNDFAPMIAAAAILTVTGLVVTGDAYRRWLATEFD